MQNISDIEFHSSLPYPAVQAAGTNPMYAEAMLDNLGGQNSEMSAISLYFYDHLITYQTETVARVFHNISIVEMHHLEIFGTLAMQLGEDPRLWSRTRSNFYSLRQGPYTWWSPAYSCRKRPASLHQVLLFAASQEKAAADKYLAQAQWILDCNVQDNLNRLLRTN
ncbi:manganese catalase family protein [Clostridium sp. AM58-1XD]|uniref:ferritin-like domain-containing protein n=1 Tax=Clostridium sp. AM58-1XD TaxID=2292307 RepID=UPI001FA8912C|nr:manganese catalase family protein [Clostridium sp. AM58-1XD]